MPASCTIPDASSFFYQIHLLFFIVLISICTTFHYINIALFGLYTTFPYIKFLLESNRNLYTPFKFNYIF